MSSELGRKPPDKPTYNAEPLGHQYSRESVLNLGIVAYRAQDRFLLLKSQPEIDLAVEIDEFEDVYSEGKARLLLLFKKR